MKLILYMPADTKLAGRPEHPPFDNEAYLGTLVAMFALFSKQTFDLNWAVKINASETCGKLANGGLRWADEGPCKRKSDFTG